MVDAEETQRHRVLALEKGPPQDATSIVFMDWPALVDGTYEAARAALTMVAGMMEELPLDPESLPAATLFTRFFQPTVGWTRQAAPAVRLIHVESSFGPETALGVLGGAGALATRVPPGGAGARCSSRAPRATRLSAENVALGKERSGATRNRADTVTEPATRASLSRALGVAYDRRRAAT